ncbi:hypothetical protein A3J17_03655 [Candidatus Curtissbacteria bacterium RIFCSPLOWO2_02_FULL_40_11]|uniref:TrpR like protein, YerC/YecD n=2 Tax=Candidatus Curtissiibacteriota TaxID=1752717 RepID=A0A1F5GBS6_9BACT|nr:MAG: hypothetical protein A3D04_03840 [Candidatus Curtissbacteria bacterium RIFCSPHIGHO2_02_FULL_40_16b]OGD90958.1 MAG: hypothetical protein A3E11_00395 [Candidatus Curtissbacteria bacterium RIFCSPHIGHO2_12_FULL_38_37]OGE01056.1 MAG: hypothetical protein A3J17_03655 [Candidatus Curtissbacteria bacterium RIFCSPLOWO2_02_FULL_40_11]OGE12840.1 MAG: hypothetical protein A3G14_00855 [Candidatus Curtissbacteria bacterium RIFCSPLOWO2_12_FULL_38_9]
MSRVSKKVLNRQIEEQMFETLWESVSQVKNKEDVKLFLGDLLSPVERIMVAKRLAIAVMLLKGHNYETIIDILRVSNETISKIALALRLNRGYKIAIDKIIRSEAGRQFWQDIENLLYRMSSPGKVFLPDEVVTYRLGHNKKKTLL